MNYKKNEIKQYIFDELNNKTWTEIIDIKDDLGLFDMNEIVNEAEIPLWLTDNREFEKAVIVSTSYNDFEKRVYGILGPKQFKLAKVANPGAMKDFYDSINGRQKYFST